MNKKLSLYLLCALAGSGILPCEGMEKTEFIKNSALGIAFYIPACYVIALGTTGAHELGHALACKALCGVLPRIEIDLSVRKFIESGILSGYTFVPKELIKGWRGIAMLVAGPISGMLASYALYKIGKVVISKICSTKDTSVSVTNKDKQITAQEEILNIFLMLACGIQAINNFLSLMPYPITPITSDGSQIFNIISAAWHKNKFTEKGEINKSNV